jgi:3',5'-cyclic AMP phosphodiesterase CpdA
MPKLAHLSDIHFGPTFDVETWNNVRTLIRDFNPDIIVVSGDFVDEPDPFDLLAAKCELEDLCQACASTPQFFVVPGNHDVLETGNVANRFRLGTFERIMFSDTRLAREKIEKGLAIRLGLNAESNYLSWQRKVKRFLPRNAIWRNVNKKICDGRLQSCTFRRQGWQWPIESQQKQISLACFNSNPSRGRVLAFATGEVSAEQVTRLGRTDQHRAFKCDTCQLQSSQEDRPCAILMHVAVLHHHPVPIALSSESKKRRQSEGKLEPFLVLRNSGDLLHKLQQQKFDLVLHGHKHKSQFARIELEADGAERYPLLVLAGGSTAKNNESSADNTLRLIETEPNGRLIIWTIEDGRIEPAGASSNKCYREPIALLKQRVFQRSKERTRRTAEEMHSFTEIDHVGHLWNTDGVRCLRSLGGGISINEIPFRITIPAYGEKFEDRLKPTDDCQNRIALCWRDRNQRYYDLDAMPADRDGGCCCISINESLQPGSLQRLTFDVRSGVANAIATTRWELEELARTGRRGKIVKDKEYETFSKFVSYPVDRLLMELRLPPDLDAVVPQIHCARHQSYPEWPLTYLFDEMADTDHFKIDEDLQAEEASRLRYNPFQRTWSLDIERPIPGYRYGFRWKVPNLVAGDSVILQTKQYQRMLLDFSSRLGTAEETESDRQCVDVFDVLASGLMERFSAEIAGEFQRVFLMIYDSKDGQLRLVLSNPRGESASEKVFTIPLGAGVAGAAMVRRQVVVWGEDKENETLIRPVQMPGLNARHVLALPVCHQHHEAHDGRLDLEPGAVIGVVTLASDAEGSGIIECRSDTDDAKRTGREAQVAAQLLVTEMLELLSMRQPKQGAGILG